MAAKQAKNKSTYRASHPPKIESSQILDQSEGDMVSGPK